jgi:hypothetical protein
MKALGTALFRRFTDMIGLEDQGERLRLIRREEELKEQFKELKSDEAEAEECFANARDLGCVPDEG